MNYVMQPSHQVDY